MAKIWSVFVILLFDGLMMLVAFLGFLHGAIQGNTGSGILFLLVSFLLASAMHIVLGRGSRKAESKQFQQASYQNLPLENGKFAFGVTLTNVGCMGFLFLINYLDSLYFPTPGFILPLLPFFCAVLTIVGLPASSFISGYSLPKGIICSLLNFSVGFLAILMLIGPIDLP
jgi:hypothetical protein